MAEYDIIVFSILVSSIFQYFHHKSKLTATSGKMYPRSVLLNVLITKRTFSRNPHDVRVHFSPDIVGDSLSDLVPAHRPCENGSRTHIQCQSDTGTI